MASRPPAMLSKSPSSDPSSESKSSPFILTNETLNPFTSRGANNALMLYPPTPSGNSQDTSMTESARPTRDLKTFNLLALPGMGSRPAPDSSDHQSKSEPNPALGHELTSKAIQETEISPVIKAIDDSVPCQFRDLPLEIRYQIYDYVLAGTDPPILPWRIALRGQPPQIHEKWDCPLLDVCRATRFEISCSYYTSTVFEIDVNYLNFHNVLSWTKEVPDLYRDLLPQTYNLRIFVNPNLDHRFKSIRLTRRMPLWTYTGFGIDKHLITQEHRMHFLVFCQMAMWWQRSDYDIPWDYHFENRAEKNKRRGGVDLIQARARLLSFQKELVTVLKCPCVHISWTRNRGAKMKAKMEEEAVKFVNALDSWWSKELKGGAEDKGDDECVEWAASMAVLRAAIEKLLD